jgi:ribosomal protein L6P/L9E
MSRIGRKPISLPKGVTCTFSEADRKVTVKGPKGELKQIIEPDFKIEIAGESIEVQRPTEQKRHKAQHGLYRSLIAGMVEGVRYRLKSSRFVKWSLTKEKVSGSWVNMCVERLVKQLLNNRSYV